MSKIIPDTEKQQKGIFKSIDKLKENSFAQGKHMTLLRCLHCIDLMFNYEKQYCNPDHISDRVWHKHLNRMQRELKKKIREEV